MRRPHTQGPWALVARGVGVHGGDARTPESPMASPPCETSTARAPMSRRAALRVLGLAPALWAAGCGRAKPSGKAGSGAAAQAPSAGAAPQGGAVAGTAEAAAARAGASARATATRLGSGPRGVALGAGQYKRPDGGTAFVLAAVDLDRHPLAARRVALSFFGHGLAFDPTRPTRALLFEKHGPGCCELDLAALRVVRPVATVPERQFYGHGVFTADGATVLATETVTKTGKGVIVTRDGQTLERTGTFPSYGLAPHDCLLVDGGRTLAVTNGGGPVSGGGRPGLALIDVATQRLMESIPLADAQANAGHVAVSAAGDAVVVSAPRDGLDAHAKGVHGQVSVRQLHGKGPLRSAVGDIVPRLRGEVLSLAIDDAAGVVAATNPSGGLVTLWDLTSGKLLSSVDRFAQPRGIALTRDRSAYVLSWGADTRLGVLDLHTLQPKPAGTLARSWISGSHLYVRA